ncbi:cadherin domain-containing protein [Sphingomonas sp. Y38-1Y]|uniref:cadherin domain-containing protein n=1 Tax=Sphingomonas sp. Y38-1Y TaxID=3078265 RepID=UPI0028EE48F7|nr:cadherin domain-containing protein [Sphingomonas sp. Y38-1Y]
MTKRVSHPGAVNVPAAKHVGSQTPAEAAAIAAANTGIEIEAAAPKMVATVEAPGAMPVAMLQDAAAPAPAQDPAPATTTSYAETDSSDDQDYTPYIVGGVLLAGGIVALALSGGDDDDDGGSTPTPPPANTAPTFTSATTATIAENAPATTIVIDVNATDAQNNTITYSLGGTDAALFNINASTGEVTLKSSANFEAKSSYAITVTATDNGSPAASASQNITVTVTNVNEAPAFATATATATVAENSATSTVVFDANATDPDANTTLTYSLTGTDAAAFTIDAATGEVRFRASPDFETKSSYSVNVVASDGANGLTATQALTVNVTNVNEAPVFAAATATATVAENVPTSTVVFDANATDPDAGTTLTYSLGGTDAAAFTIDAATGEVRFRASPDFETKASYSFTVTASDGANPALTATQTVTVTVTDQGENQAPVFTSAATATVAENAAISTVILDANATDAENNAITYSLSGADAAAFTINATTGELRLNQSADFETKASYSLNIVATDNGNPAASTTQAVTVNVTNVNEAPVIAGGDAVTVAFDENVAIGTQVLDVNATDVDANTTLTYSISGADASSFTIDAATGVVAFAISPDFEAKTSYNFVVTATDNGNPALSDTQTVTVNINNLPDLVDLDGGTIPATETRTYSAANGNVSFGENAGEGNLSVITNFTAGDIIVTDVATSRYSFSSVGDDLVISLNNGGVVTSITLQDAVSPNALIFNEATAEAAIGFNFFQSSIPPAPPASNNLDGAGVPSVFDASQAANTYTDRAGITNNTTINGFSADDRIVVTGTSGTSAATRYGFTSIDNDLVITFNQGGITSRIVITDVVSPNALITNEASAEAAIGFDFFSYA